MIDRVCLSLSNRCNLKCKYCHFQDKQQDCDSFDTKQLIEIIDNIHHYCERNRINKFKLGIVGSGEPLLNFEELRCVIEYIVDKKYTEFAIYTITNGTLLTEEKLEWFYLYRDIIKLCFSLDGYEQLHNVGRIYYDQVFKSIQMYKNRFEHMPSINTTVNKLSIQNKDILIKYFIENDMLDVTFSKLVGYSEHDLYISDGDFKFFMDYVKQSGIISRQFRNEKVYDCTMYGKFCGVGRTNVFITPEGIYPCGRFYKNEKYFLGMYNFPLEKVEKEMIKFSPVQDGKCYYIEKVEGKIC